jgi:hypothetical protein
MALESYIANWVYAMRIDGRLLCTLIILSGLSATSLAPSKLRAYSRRLKLYVPLIGREEAPARVVGADGRSAQPAEVEIVGKPANTPRPPHTPRTPHAPHAPLCTSSFLASTSATLSPPPSTHNRLRWPSCAIRRSSLLGQTGSSRCSDPLPRLFWSTMTLTSATKLPWTLQGSYSLEAFQISV